MKKHHVIIFFTLLFISYVIYNESTRERLVKRNKKEVVIDTKSLNNILDSVNDAQDSVSKIVYKLSVDNEKHNIKHKKLKDSLNILNKEKRHLENKIQYLEQEKTRQIIVQKISDTTSEK